MRLYLTPYYRHQNDSCIKMGSDESHFNVSLIVRDKVTRQCPQTTTFEEKLRRAEEDSNRPPSAHQPNALPLGQPGSHRTQAMVCVLHFCRSSRGRRNFLVQCVLPQYRVRPPSRSCSPGKKAKINIYIYTYNLKRLRNSGGGAGKSGDCGTCHL